MLRRRLQASQQANALASLAESGPHFRQDRAVVWWDWPVIKNCAFRPGRGVVRTPGILKRPRLNPCPLGAAVRPNPWGIVPREFPKVTFAHRSVGPVTPDVVVWARGR